MLGFELYHISKRVPVRNPTVVRLFMLSFTAYVDTMHIMFSYSFMLTFMYQFDTTHEKYLNNLTLASSVSITHDDVIKWKHFPRYWSFVRGIHRSPVNSPRKGPGRGALMFSLICTRING